jgi:hypothetical protein
MELILHIGRIGSDRERKLLGGFFPLLRSFVAHSLFEILLTFFSQRRYRHHQNTEGEQQ